MLLKIAIIKMILETLGTIIFDLINYIGVFIENAGIMDKLLIFMLFILLILLIWLMFRKRFKKEVSAQAAVELAKPATSEDRAREAAELAANKEYAAAIRRLYLSVLLNLHERNILDFVSTKTNWEYLGELQGNRALFQELEKLIEIFEHKFYGLEPASAEDWEEFSRISGGLKSAAR
jgi:cbb3-type cytochrome oxidase subunit 3